jgi:transcriptional regulator with XRE-family HTH domain
MVFHGHRHEVRGLMAMRERPAGPPVGRGRRPGPSADTVSDAAEEPDGERIGARLKAARLARRKTIADVARESGLTKGFLSKLERDQSSASVASLMRLCEALGISVGSLFQSSNGEIVRHGAYQRINFGGARMHEYLLTPFGEQRLQAILSDLEPGGGSGEEPYSLPSDVEFAFVIEGRLEITVRGEKVALEAGDAFTFPPRSQHCFRSIEPAALTRVLWVFSPALPVDRTVHDFLNAQASTPPPGGSA